jgi:hypothetical protein
VRFAAVHALDARTPDQQIPLPRLSGSGLCERVCSLSVIYRLQVLLLLKPSQHGIELTPDNRVVHHCSPSEILSILPNPLAAWLSPNQSSAHTSSRFSPTLITEPNK